MYNEWILSIEEKMICSQDFDFCVFDESTNFKIYVVIDITECVQYVDFCIFDEFSNFEIYDVIIHTTAY